MSRALRITQIDQLLHNRRVVSLQTFLDTLEVSRATFKRDLEFLRDQLNAPIVFDRERGGYRFDAQSATGPKYELPGLWLSGQEAFALLTAHELLEHLEPGLLSEHIAPIKSRLMALLAHEHITPDTVARKLNLVQKMRRHLPSKFFTPVAHATLTERRLQITHFNRHSGEQTERLISPLRLTHYRDNWYVDAWCHQKAAVRSFSIDAIQSVQLLPDAIHPVSRSQLDQALGEGYGIYRGKKKETAHLRITPRRAQWSAHIVWHARQKTWWDDDGYFHVTFPYTDDREVLSDIQALLPDITVQAPDSLKATLRAVLTASLDSF